MKKRKRMNEKGLIGTGLLESISVGLGLGIPGLTLASVAWIAIIVMVVGGLAWTSVVLLSGSQVGGSLDLIPYMNNAYSGQVTIDTATKAQLRAGGINADINADKSIYKVVVNKAIQFDADDFHNKGSESRLEVKAGTTLLFTIYATGYDDPWFGESSHHLQVVPNPGIEALQPLTNDMREASQQSKALKCISKRKLDASPKEQLGRLFPINERMALLIGPTDNEEWVSGDEDFEMEGFIVYMDKHIYLAIKRAEQKFASEKRGSEILGNVFRALDELDNLVTVTVEVSPYNTDAAKTIEITFSKSASEEYKDARRENMVRADCKQFELKHTSDGTTGVCNYKLVGNNYYKFKYSAGEDYIPKTTGPMYLTPPKGEEERAVIYIKAEPSLQKSVVFEEISQAANTIKNELKRRGGGETEIKFEDIEANLNIKIGDELRIFEPNKEDNIIIIPSVDKDQRITYTLKILGCPPINGTILIKEENLEDIRVSPYTTGSRTKGEGKKAIDFSEAVKSAIEGPKGWPLKFVFGARIQETNYIRYASGKIEPNLTIYYGINPVEEGAKMNLSIIGTNKEYRVSGFEITKDPVQHAQISWDRLGDVQAGEYKLSVEFYKEESGKHRSIKKIDLGKINIRNAPPEATRETLRFSQLIKVVSDKKEDIQPIIDTSNVTIPVEEALTIMLNISKIDQSKDLYLAISESGDGEFGCSKIESITTKGWRQTFFGEIGKAGLQTPADQSVGSTEYFKMFRQLVRRSLKIAKEAIDKLLNAIQKKDDRQTITIKPNVIEGAIISPIPSGTMEGPDKIIIGDGKLSLNNLYIIAHNLLQLNTVGEDAAWMISSINNTSIKDLQGKKFKFMACQFNDTPVPPEISEAYVTITFGKKTDSVKVGADGTIQIKFDEADLRNLLNNYGYSINDLKDNCYIQEVGGSGTIINPSKTVEAYKLQFEKVRQKTKYQLMIKLPDGSDVPHPNGEFQTS